MLKRSFLISAGTVVNALFVGAKRVKGPGPLNTSTNWARDKAARSVDRVGVAITKSTMVPSEAGAPVGDAVTGAEVGAGVAPGTGGAVGALVGALVGGLVGALAGADVILVSSPRSLKKASSKGFTFSAFKVLSE